MSPPLGKRRPLEGRGRDVQKRPLEWQGSTGAMGVHSCSGRSGARRDRWLSSRRALALIGLLVAATSADPAAARNDLISSSARFSSGATYDPRHRLRPRRIERRLPADDVPAPTFPTATGADHAPATHASAWHKQLPVGGAVGHSLLVIGAVIVAQTLGDHQALPQLMRAVRPSPTAARAPLLPPRSSLRSRPHAPSPRVVPLSRRRRSSGGSARARSGRSRWRRRAHSACTARRTRSLSASPPAATAAPPCPSTFADCCARV